MIIIDRFDPRSDKPALKEIFEEEIDKNISNWMSKF